MEKTSKIKNIRQTSKISVIDGKRVVCLGGGNAMPKAVLTGLKKHPVDLSVVCAMLDSGGSAGRLRKDYNIISPGDIRRAFIVLANTSPVVENLLNYRFETGELKGHNFANLLITAMELNTGSYEKTIDEMRGLLNIKHQIFPSTLDNSNLFAVLENGEVISGETNIDVPKHDGNLKIKEVFLKPKAKAYQKSIDAIKNAELVIIGPGDLYSSIAQILLVDGISEAIKESKGKKVYICNLMTKYGETNDFSVEDFSKEIEKYLGLELDFVIYNNKKISPASLKKYQKEHPELLGQVKFGKKLNSKKFIGRDLLLSSEGIVHDPDKVCGTILETLNS
jgi:uncharacterized cofD-like protein